ncbi:MAG: translation elongation factor Ts [Chloroflexi bacterium RBG_13_56_8]|nr:MAG: translation elongation factor Ts [Chloroflexi bacterium RBG_13_56_8]
MTVTTQMVKELRQQTGAGIMDCKNTLEETSGDMAKAAQILREKGAVAAAKKTEREASEGRIEAYVHPGDKLAVLVEVNCETDFVARTSMFQEFTHDLAMQIAAMNPSWVSRGDIPAEVLKAQTEEYRAEMAGGNKPEHIMERIIEGKLAKFYQQKCLLEQPFIKDDAKTIQQLLIETIAGLGENIVIKRFARFEIS